MTTPTFGPPIPCEGKRPAWLTFGTTIKAKVLGECDTSRWVEGSEALDAPWYWGDIGEICLPADHWAYEPISRGFEPWAGGAEAPGDWDGGEVLYRNQVIGAWPCVWEHGENGGDIIGYKRLAKPASPAEESDGAPLFAGQTPMQASALHSFMADLSPSEFATIASGDEGETLLHAIVGALPSPNTVTLERMSLPAWGDALDLAGADLMDWASILRHLDLIAPPETPLDRFYRERGVTDETKAIIREAMEAMK